MARAFKIVTYNLRCVWNGDGVNSFVHRVGLIWDKIQTELPDVVAFQEVIPKSLEMLKLIMPNYSFYGQGRMKDFSGEGLYIAVKNDTAQVLGVDSFWLSPKPTVPESRFSDQSTCPRICVAATVLDKISGKRLRVYNVHLDHVGEGAKEKGIACVLERMAKDNEETPLPQVLLGDFNAFPNSVAVMKCKEQKLFDVTDAFAKTYHNFGTPNSEVGKIDYIFVTENLKPLTKEVTLWNEMQNGIYLSDHYPVSAEFLL